MTRSALPSFTPREALALADSLWMIDIRPDDPAALAAEVAYAIAAEALDTKWNVDAVSLLTRLHTLTPGEALALAAAVEQFWAEVAADPARCLRQALADVGLAAQVQ